jgi:hypothetical protein
MYSLLMAKKKVKIALAATDDGHQQSLDRAAAADAREGIRQGLKESGKGLGQPAREFFKEFEKTYGLPRLR